MKRFLKQIAALWLIGFVVIRPVMGDQQPPYDVKNPAISEDFRNAYLGLDNLSLLTQLLTYTFTGAVNLLCIDSPTFCVDAVNHQILASSGTVSNPAYAFAASPSSGLYKRSAPSIGIAVNGVRLVEFDSAANFACDAVPLSTNIAKLGDSGHYWNTLYVSSAVFGDATAAAPSIVFSSDLTTGFYRAASQLIGSAANGILTWTFGATISAQTSGATIRNAAGSANAPSYTIAGLEGDGMYSAGTNILGFATNGIGRMGINASGNVGIGTVSPSAGYRVDIRNQVAGNMSQIRMAGDDGTSDGGSGIQMYYNGTLKWSMFHRNVTNHAHNLVFSTTENDVTGSVLELTTNGEVLEAKQPCFLTTDPTGATDKTGDGTVFVEPFGTEVFDKANNVNGSTFTASVTGKYLLSASMILTGIPGAATSSLAFITTSNRTYNGDFRNATGALVTTQYQVCVIADMDAGDTAIFAVAINGSTKTADIFASANYNYFSGSLIN